MKRSLLVAALTLPLLCSAMDPDLENRLKRAAATLLDSPHHVTDPIKEHFAEIGQQAITMVEVSYRDEAYEKRLAEFEAQLERIHENICRLQAYSNEFSESNWGTPAENAAAKTVSDAANLMLNAQPLHAQRLEANRQEAQRLDEQAAKLKKGVTYQRGTFAGFAAGFMCWIAKLNPLKTYRTSYELNRTRFTGFELAAAANAAGSTAKSLFGPIATIVVIGIIWYQFKNMIVEPYKLKHQQELDKFKGKLNKHKEETEQKLEKFRSEINKANGTMSDAMKGLREDTAHAMDGMHAHIKAHEKQVNQQLHTMQEAHTHHLQTVKEDTQAFKQKMVETQAQTAQAHAKTLAEIEERNRKLREQIEKDNTELQAQLVKDQADFTVVVNEFTTGLKQSHDNLREDVEKMAETTKQVKDKCDKAVEKLAAALVTMQKIKETSVEQLGFLKKNPQAAKGGMKLVASPRGSERKVA